jgi:hypothetical protein
MTSIVGFCTEIANINVKTGLVGGAIVATSNYRVWTYNIFLAITHDPHLTRKILRIVCRKNRFAY